MKRPFWKSDLFLITTSEPGRHVLSKQEGLGVDTTGINSSSIPVEAMDPPSMQAGHDNVVRDRCVALMRVHSSVSSDIAHSGKCEDAVTMIVVKSNYWVQHFDNFLTPFFMGTISCRDILKIDQTAINILGADLHIMKISYRCQWGKMSCFLLRKGAILVFSNVYRILDKIQTLRHESWMKRGLVQPWSHCANTSAAGMYVAKGRQACVKTFKERLSKSSWNLLPCVWDILGTAVAGDIRTPQQPCSRSPHHIARRNLLALWCSIMAPAVMLWWFLPIYIPKDHCGCILCHKRRPRICRCLLGWPGLACSWLKLKYRAAFFNFRLKCFFIFSTLHILLPARMWGVINVWKKFSLCCLETDQCCLLSPDEHLE